MPNWCYTIYAFTGKKEQVIDFHTKLKEITNGPERVKSDFGSPWLGNIVDYFGFDWRHMRCRGEVTYISPEVKVKEGRTFFYMSVTTAWSPSHELFDDILDEHYRLVDFYFRTEEEGGEFFEINDEDGIFFPERYGLSLFVVKEDGDYVEYDDLFSDPKEIIKIVNNALGKNLESLDEIRDFFGDEENVGPDDYCNIKEYELAK